MQTMHVSIPEKYSYTTTIYSQIENVIRKMQDSRQGIPLKSSLKLRFQKKEHSFFSGSSFFEWLRNYFEFGNDPCDRGASDKKSCDSIVRHIASIFLFYGYIVPVEFDENTFYQLRNSCDFFYRFQTTFFWPSNYRNLSALDYVVYLCKRTMQNKLRHNLSNKEAEDLAFLQKYYENQWEFVYMQAQAQIRVNDENRRDQCSRKILEDQERCFWYVSSNSIIDTLKYNSIALNKSTTISEAYRKQILLLRIKLERKLYVVTKTTESHFKYYKYLVFYDHFCGNGQQQQQQQQQQQTEGGNYSQLSTTNSDELNRSSLIAKKINDLQSQQLHSQLIQQSQTLATNIYDQIQQHLISSSSLLSSNNNGSSKTNPWILQSSDTTEIWKQYESNFNLLTAERVKKWSLSLRELLKDDLGYENFLKFLDKEYSSENLRFLNAIENLKKISQREIERKSHEIWNEFLSNEANYPINIDSKSYELTKNSLENPSRWSFDIAANHVYSLMKNDSYYRFLKSNSYTNLIGTQATTTTAPTSTATTTTHLAAATDSYLESQSDN